MANFLKWILVATIYVSQLESKDFGIYGSTTAIEEEDLIKFLSQKMQTFTEEDRHDFIQTMRNHFTSRLEMTMEVEGIQKALLYSVTYFDPSISVDRDILNLNKEVVVKKGSCFNPLSKVSLDQDLLFFDAMDPDQLAWAQSQKSSSKWILVKGHPVKLEENLNRPIYFDQSGALTNKFGIKHVPARVSQHGWRLKIEEIPSIQVTSCAT